MKTWHDARALILEEKLGVPHTSSEPEEQKSCCSVKSLTIRKHTSRGWHRNAGALILEVELRVHRVMTAASLLVCAGVRLQRNAS